MLDGIFRNPTEILFGKTALSGVGPRIRAFGGKALIVHGNAFTRYGLADRVRGELERAGVDYLELGGVKPNPTADLVYEGIGLCRERGITVLLAVGGGSVIDSAKAIGAGVHYGGDFFDFFDRKAVPTKTLPVACIVTIFGAGSESSDAAVISKDGRKYGCGSPVMYPVFSVLDPTLTETVPAFLLACGIFDSACHIMERYFSPTPNVETSDELCFSLLRVLFNLGPRLLADPANYELRANLMWASKLAHDNTIGFGRKHDWGTHTIAHEVGARCGRTHGSILAVLYPAWMTYIQPLYPEFFYELGRRVLGIEGASRLEVGLRAVDEVRAFTRKLGLPSTLGELGLTGDGQFDSIAAACCATTLSGTIGNLRRLTRNEIVYVLQIAEGSHSYDYAAHR